jgi:hypothetical protein
VHVRGRAMRPADYTRRLLKLMRSSVPLEQAWQLRRLLISCEVSLTAHQLADLQARRSALAESLMCIRPVIAPASDASDRSCTTWGFRKGDPFEMTVFFELLRLSRQAPDWPDQFIRIAGVGRVPR